MNKLSILTAAFFVVLILSFPLSLISGQLFSIMLLIAAFIIILGLYFLLSQCKIKKIGKIRVESVQYPFMYVLRAYTKPKNLWIVYDEETKKFRAANWTNLPVKSILVILFGMFFLYTSYLIWFTLHHVLYLLFFRAIVLFLFLFMGLYSLSVGLYRLFSINSKKADKICKFWNKNKFLRNLIRKGMVHAEISPNFLIKEGFVNSVEFILHEKFELEKLEKILIDTAKLVQKL